MDLDYLKVRAQLDGDRIAVIDPNKGKEWTYRALDSRAKRLAVYLRHKGVGPGDRVALFAPNDVAYFDLLFACTKLGAIMVPLNWRLKSAELEHVIADCQPKGFLYAGNHLERISFVGPDRLWVDIDSQAYHGICDQGDPELEEWAGGDLLDPAYLIYTSGTTGLPKGVIVTQQGMIHNSLYAIVSWGIGPDIVTLASAPMFHIAGFAGTVLPALMIGGKVIIQRYFDPTQAVDLIEKYRITHLFMVPMMYYTMLKAENFRPSAFDDTEVLISGGAPPSDWVLETFAKWGITIINSYGLSEAGPHNFRMNVQEAFKRPGSIGKPILFIDVQILDENRQPVTGEEIGELVIKGKHVCGGYWKKDDVTAESFHQGYFLTGDLAKRDKDGYYYIVDRKKELIITGGENVLPSEVERVLKDHPNVMDAIVVGCDHPQYGESVAAAVIPTEGASLEELEEVLDVFATERLAGYKTPKHYYFVKQFPETSVGKVDRMKLRKEITGRLERSGKE